VEKNVLEKIPDQNLRAYVVWVPVLRAGPFESAAHSESGRIADRRVTQYLDPGASLAKAYASVIHLPSPVRAWDVYFVFGPDARWPEGQGSDQPPQPTYWMHQLGRAAPPELLLDGDRLARSVRELIFKHSQ